MAHHGASDDGEGSIEHEPVVGGAVNTLAVLAGLDVAKITVVSSGLAWAAVSHTLGVPVGPSSLAALNQVAELVDVETVLARGEAVHLAVNLYGFALNLHELGEAADTRAAIRVQNAHSVVSFLALDHCLLRSICLPES
eukprot:CAMPEP_0170464110 /NCGR_PEP_ID=MMETSP0123-20130129/8963_1 /TAXON_ID=182087 /ORGANISM="Favella ehrenbergii, Strain Fehren 1" /LENGTH=138 /DNA_ID=CAMNT_0010729697 /DNA_START=274 /DNA_END=687 /DNA_ORIENTATION=-